ncbi:glyoxalase-like domain protein [Oxobacter pfennigii]|uniref:Glyoxalase-like domain protein n=1 Tax=Oxobacter pfennigii TaxID=36849 RepID=A0A0P8YYV2_9CLOT|nr:VOC family protein [Oxobacter pfennigii]KPU44974.1 glyoxalase-like domain protein [Oxobacter pfennigii]
MKIKYVHTNIIANDWKKVSLFYQKVFGCKPIPPERNLKGEWVDKLTGLPDAHITGEHLALPGYEGSFPTLEIFSYGSMINNNSKEINNVGFGHLAFEVDDVENVLQRIKEEGGGQVGELIKAEYPNNVIATLVYAKDIEGNIIELQSWETKSDV